MKQNIIKVDSDLSLKAYYPYYKKTLIWYQDLELCKMVDNIDYVYDLQRLKSMYKYLNKRGETYYIKFNNRLVGDITLLETGEITIVIESKYQNMQIGRRTVLAIIERAKAKEINEVWAKIYDFNHHSIKMFEAIGFVKKADNVYYKRVS